MVQNGLKVEIFDSFEAANVDRIEWDKFVLQVSGDIYVTYDWCRIWWRHYGQGRDLRLFVYRMDGEIVGLLPMFTERVWLGPIGLKIAKRVGADFALTVFSLAIVDSHIERLCHEVISSLIDGDACDAVWFGPMRGDDPTADHLRKMCDGSHQRFEIFRDESQGPHTVFDLPDSYTAYVDGLKKRQRQNYRRDINLLSKNFKVERDVLQRPEGVSEAFAAFASLHNRQWKSEGKLGHFGDWPDSMAFNNDLVREFSHHDRCRIFRLFLDGRLVASQYAFVFGDCCYWRLPARAPDDELDRFGLGRLGLMHLIEVMISEGVQHIEAGRGHYEYKLQLGGRELDVRSIVIGRRQLWSAVRARVFLGLADLFHLAYYRIWFARVAPRMRLLQPLWRIWIRCRL